MFNPQAMSMVTFVNHCANFYIHYLAYFLFKYNCKPRC